MTPVNRLSRRGINYDTGINFMPGYLSREFWHRSAVERDMRAIAHDLHCDTVTVLGSEIERLRDAAEIALAEGLDVWIQPRFVEGTRTTTLEHLARAADLAEELRMAHPDRITLNVGCELSLFMKGILPGRTFMSRIRVLTVAWLFMPLFSHRLNAHLRAACELARSRFHGPLTYSSGEWEGVDWAPFDYVGVDYYRQSSNAATYVEQLRRFRRHGKPVVITEFGCCTYQGAENRGGAGFMIVKWGDPPTIKSGYVRDERVQADHLGELREIYEREGVDAAFVYAFSEPSNPFDPDPTRDLDMAGYGIVKVVRLATADEVEEWEPKAAFARLRDLNKR
ncbi:hypothetical protein AB0F81_25435 [Actinoplanes sp. NPDC024001]|uniref:hypothetical protein n=1 Tax=Actinoplanes sp. NPDC024001 TaxID=3154598 RepID=UPI0033CDE722